MARISTQIVHEQMEAIASWSAGRASSEALRFASRQPSVNTYVLSAMEHDAPEAIGFALHMALAIDAIYEHVLERVPRRVTPRIMDSAAAKAEEGFAQLVGVEPELALRRLLFQRDLAEPGLLVELMRVMMEESADEPDLERGLGIVFLVVKAVALAYECANGLATADCAKGSLAQVLERRLGRPLPKMARGEPCPCGSGRKFKQCCGGSETATAPAATRAGATRLGNSRTEQQFKEYWELIAGTVSYCGLVRHESDGRWWQQQRAELEQRYRPGHPGGLPEALVSTYLLYDLVLPAAERTIGELMLEREGHTLPEPASTRLRHLCESYVGLYELVECRPEDGTKRLRELGTDVMWSVGDVEDPSAESGTIGEVWLCRLAGPPTAAVTVMMPLIYPPQARPCLENFLRFVAQDCSTNGQSRSHAIRAAMKRGVPLLAEYLTSADQGPDSGQDRSSRS